MGWTARGGRQDGNPPGWSVGPVAILVLAAAGTMLLAGQPARALTIETTFDSSITSSANAVTIENAINGALAFYRNFSNPVTVNIDYKIANLGTGGLGASQSSYYFGSYATFTGALAVSAVTYHNTIAATAQNNLGSGNFADQILATSANYQALGLSAPGYVIATGGAGGTFDGVVYLSNTNLSGFGGSGVYPETQTIQHETDEVLGIGGAGSVLNDMLQNGLTTAPTDADGSFIGAMDLYRYSAPGTPSLTTSGTAVSYFSVDGGDTKIVAFNQNPNQNAATPQIGDFGDWGAPGCSAYVQQAFSCPYPGASLTPTSPEVLALQAIGYAVPEPASLAVFGASLFGLAVVRRRRDPGAGIA